MPPFVKSYERRIVQVPLSSPVMVSRYGSPSPSRYCELLWLTSPFSQLGWLGVVAVPHGTAILASVPLRHWSRLVPTLSEKAVWALRPEERPAAVIVKVRPASLGAGAKSCEVKEPWASAETERDVSGWVSGSSRIRRVTVSPGCQPEPVMVTVRPGA